MDRLPSMTGHPSLCPLGSRINLLLAEKFPARPDDLDFELLDGLGYTYSGVPTSAAEDTQHAVDGLDDESNIEVLPERYRSFVAGKLQSALDEHIQCYTNVVFQRIWVQLGLWSLALMVVVLLLYYMGSLVHDSSECMLTCSIPMPVVVLVPVLWTLLILCASVAGQLVVVTNHKIIHIFPHFMSLFLSFGFCFRRSFSCSEIALDDLVVDEANSEKFFDGSGTLVYYAGQTRTRIRINHIRDIERIVSCIVAAQAKNDRLNRRGRDMGIPMGMGTGYDDDDELYDNRFVIDSDEDTKFNIS